MTASPRTLSLASAAAAILAAGISAQQGDSPSRAPRPVAGGAYESVQIDLLNDVVIRDAIPNKSAVDTFCYVNTDTVGAFIAPGELGSETLVDWGLMGGTASTGCAGVSEIVSRIQFSYATSAPDPSIGAGAELTLTWYTNYAGFGIDSGNLPVASFAFTGLPGLSGSTTGGTAVGFSIDIDLTGGLEFCLPTGQIALGFSSPEASLAGDGFANSGPLLCATPAFPGVDPATGQEDVIDSWLPDTTGAATTFNFGGFGDATFHVAVARADLSGSPATVAFRNGGTNPASFLAGPPVLGGNFTATVDNVLAGETASGIFGFNAPISVTLGPGQTLLCLDTVSGGDLWTGAGLGPVTPGPVDVYSFPLPKRLDLCGFSVCSQALQFGTPPFTLSNAQDVVLGG